MRAENTTDTRARAVRGAARHHPVLILATTLIGLVLGAGYVQYGPSHFTSSATLVVTPLTGNPYTTDDRGDALDNLQTEAQVVATDAVATKAAAALKSDQAPSTLRSNVTATVPANTTVIEVKYRGSTPDEARAGAQAFANSYLTYRKDRAQQAVNAGLDSVNSQITSTSAALRDIATQQAGGQRSSYLDGRSSALSKQLATLEDSRASLSTQVLDPGTVITPAATPASSNKKVLVILGIIGAILGFVVGWLAALVRELSTARLRSAADVEVLGIPVLAEIPAPGRSRRGDRRFGAIEEGYRELRTALVASLGEAAATGPIVSFVGATDGHAPAVVSASLASVFARSGIDATLLDAGGSARASASAIYYLGQRPGLSEVLLDGRSVRDVTVEQFAGLRILPAGTRSEGAADHFLSPQMRRAIDDLRGDGRYVVVAASSAADANGQSIAILSDAVVLVVSLGTTTRHDVELAYYELERTGATVLGTVLLGRAALGTDHPVASTPQTGAKNMLGKSAGKVRIGKLGGQRPGGRDDLVPSPADGARPSKGDVSRR